MLPAVRIHLKARRDQGRNSCQAQRGPWSPWRSLEEEEDEEVVEEEEEEEGEEAMEDDTSPWRSRNGKLLRSPTHKESLPFFTPPILIIGSTYYALARINSPETAFDLFFPEDILQLILHFTNLQGRRSVN